MGFSKYFLKVALPNAVFKIFSQNSQEDLYNFFSKNEIDQFSIDSRTTKPNQIFLAIVGQRVDAHDFLQEALENGAKVLIIENKKKEFLNKIPNDLLENKLVIFVQDTLKALIELAKVWRQNFTIPIVGITGSLGKTTSKEMVANILKVANVPAFISFKNQNTTIGLSLNILNMKYSHKVGIFELGIDGIGQMEQLADILRPDVALITCISHSHEQYFGSLLKIAEQKIKIFKYFKQNNVGIIFSDQSLLSDFYYKHPIIKFGFKTKNNIQARMIKVVETEEELLTTFILKIYNQKCKIIFKESHISFVKNALAASAIAKHLNISFNDIVNGLQTFKSFENRFEKKIIKNKNGIIISDCYNANPESMKAAILAFDKIKNDGIKVAILGDMKELGAREEFWHKQIGKILSKTLNLDFIILVGKLAKLILKKSHYKMKIDYVDDWQGAQKKLNNILENNQEKKSLVLVKASRVMNLDKMVKAFSL